MFACAGRGPARLSRTRHAATLFGTHKKGQRRAHTRFAKNRTRGVESAAPAGETPGRTWGLAARSPAKTAYWRLGGDDCSGVRSVALRATGRTAFPTWATQGGRRISGLTAK